MAETGQDLSLLYGANPDPGLVGAAPFSGGMRLWWRRDGDVELEERAYRPFLLTSHRELLDGFKPAPEIVELSGANLYRWLVRTEDWQHHDDVAKHLRGIYREHRRDFEYEPYMVFTDGLNQFLLDSGHTFYHELDLTSLRVLYLGIRAVASGGADFADPRVAGDRIILAGLSDGRGYSKLLTLGDGDEAELLTGLNDAICEYDPDIIAGHSLFKGTMDYLHTRARRAKVKLEWGRDGSVVRQRRSRATAAEKQLEYPRADVTGRSLVDTWFLAQYFDIVERALEHYDAPYVARYLDANCALPDPVPPWEVERLWEEQRETLVADLSYELEAAGVIYGTLSGSYLAQAQMLPFSLQDCVVRGNGVKINNLLLREYLRRGEGIPEPAEARMFVGGYTDIRETGLIRNVLNVDIASLYPSIMLVHGVKPDADTGDVFQPMLRELTTRRLKYKQLARSAEEPAERVRASARQAALKIFINSFFGYLGTNRMNWADPLKAEFITTQGQKLVKQLAEMVEDADGKVIEIDTDGVYFEAPEGCETEDDRDALVARINAGLPEGINVELGGVYAAMLSHKVKNYALLDTDGNITIKGSGLKSRGLEPYLHRFISDSIRYILEGEPRRIRERYEELERMIEGRTISIRELAKTDTLIESLDTYTEKVEAGKRNRAAVYEVALEAKRELRPGDQVSYYITGEKASVKAYESARPLREFDPQEPDYNIKYYLKKLKQNLKKVEGYVDKDTEATLDFGDD